MDFDKCKELRKNPNRNPLTGRPIDPSKKKYKELDKECLDIEKKEKELLKSIKPDDKKRTTVKVEKIKKETSSIYPDVDDPEFQEKILGINDLYVHTRSPYKLLKSVEDFENVVKKECPENTFNKAYFQYFITHYLSNRTPYKTALLYYAMGVGKTCAAVSIAEDILSDHRSYDIEPKIYVILPASLKSNFIKTIYDPSRGKNQCTGDMYRYITKGDTNKIERAINTRYKIMTYNEFVKIADDLHLKDKTIIVDEVHNVRKKGTTKNDKTDNSGVQESKASKESKGSKSTKNSVDDINIYERLVEVLERGENNRLILMSGTPMYDKPNEIIDILNLVLVNEGKPLIKNDLFKANGDMNKDVEERVNEIAKRYISYLDNNNPYTYASRLSPPEAKNMLFQEKYNWVSKIKDGIVFVKAGKNQTGKLPPTDKNAINGFQELNVMYPHKNFNNVFQSNTTEGHYKLSYHNGSQKILSKEIINDYAPKIGSIVDTIMKSKGISIVYSRFLESGAIPLAIALEHCKMGRFGGKNIMNDLVPDKKVGKYCIITTESTDVMNTDTLDKLLTTINSKDNINGDKIKVVIITQKGSEGISFMNVRAIHVLDPWFHMNRIEQIVGRGIRRCSHINLPLEQRNVMVYLYCLYDVEKTVDIHAYEIACRKLEQTTMIKDLIRKNAVDCVIQKNVHNHNRRVFDSINPLKIEDHQGRSHTIYLGDEETTECSVVPKKKVRDQVSNIRDTDVIELLKKNIIEYMKNIDFVTLEDLVSNVKDNEGDTVYIYTALRECLYPREVITGYYLHLNRGGLQKVKTIKDTQIEIILEKKEKKDDGVGVENNKKDDGEKKNSKEDKDYKLFFDTLSGFETESDDFVRFHNFYLHITSKNWDQYCKILLNNKEKFPKMCKMLKEKGSMIPEKNIYIDLFSTKYYAYYNTGKEVPLDDYTIPKINIDTNVDLLGAYFVVEEKDKATDTKHKCFHFKLLNGLEKDVKARIKKGLGARCQTKDKATLEKILKDDFKGTKITICQKIAQKLHSMKRLLIPPYTLE